MDQEQKKRRCAKFQRGLEQDEDEVEYAFEVRARVDLCLAARLEVMDHLRLE